MQVKEAFKTAPNWAPEGPTPDLVSKRQVILLQTNGTMTSITYKEELQHHREHYGWRITTQTGYRLRYSVAFKTPRRTIFAYYSNNLDELLLMAFAAPDVLEKAVDDYWGPDGGSRCVEFNPKLFAERYTNS